MPSLELAYPVRWQGSTGGQWKQSAQAVFPVLAVDIPSGIHTDTGEVLDAAVKARATVTIACAKPGLLFDPGKRYAGGPGP